MTFAFCLKWVVCVSERFSTIMSSRISTRMAPRGLVKNRAPMPGEDVQTFEQDLPGANTTGFRASRDISSLPLETSLTMNGSWGFNITDSRFKTHRELVSYVVRAAGNGGNLLLNVGPRPDGTIQPEAASRLRALGEWMAAHGATLYGTRAGPVPPRSWGATTRRGDTVFVHVLDWQDRVLSLPPIEEPIARATMFTDGSTVTFTQSASGVTLTLPDARRDDVDRVIVLITRVRGT